MSELAIEWLDEGSAFVEDVVAGESFDVYIQGDVSVIDLDKTEFLEFDGAPAYVSAAGAGHIVYTQSSPAATWTWVHNLNSRPQIALFLDSDLSELVYTDISYPDQNTAVIEWPSPESGKAYI